MPDDRFTAPAIDNDQVNPPRQAASPGERARRAIQVAYLGPVHMLLRSPERLRYGAAYFDTHQLERRPGIDRNDVDLVTAEPYVAPDQLPACLLQVGRGIVLSLGAALLANRPHSHSVAGAPYQLLTPG